MKRKDVLANQTRRIIVLGVVLVMTAVLQNIDHTDYPTDSWSELPKVSCESNVSIDPKKVMKQEPAIENKDEQSDWRLILVNRWSKIPDDYSVNLIELGNGHAVDVRVYPDLQDMMDAARAEGLYPVICSSYRTGETQQQLFTNKVDYYLAKGYSQEEAEVEAGKWVAVPGTSEHQTGLAVDIVALSNQILDENQENTPEQKWLMENSYKYGFILRYPTGKNNITGINYEPWHYRYVGKVVAKEIYEKGICLEEYLEEDNS